MPSAQTTGSQTSAQAMFFGHPPGPGPGPGGRGLASTRAIDAIVSAAKTPSAVAFLKESFGILISILLERPCGCAHSTTRERHGRKRFLPEAAFSRTRRPAVTVLDRSAVVR